MWAAIRARLRKRSPAVERPGSEAEGRESETSDREAPSTAPERTSLADDSDLGFAEGLWSRRVREASLEEVLDDLEIALLESDVALRVVEKIRRDLSRTLAGRRLRWGADLEQAVRGSLERTVRSILARPPIDLVARVRAQEPKPFIVLFVGVNGSGKTTTIAKLAGWLRSQGLSSVIAAGDTFRAGAIEQLLVHGERLGIRVVRQQPGSDPAAVAFDAVAHARAKHLDVVLVDTAGRQHTNDNLIEEAKKIRRIVQPHLTLFVGDALSGNDLAEQSKWFHEALGLDGLVLTKLDADVKGGGALSATYVTGRPIVFVGTGQGYDDLRPFDPDWMVRRLFSGGTSG